MVQVACIGFGKMGKLTFECLKKIENIERIYVVDPQADFEENTKRIFFLKDFNLVPYVDYAFILTPVSTHYTVLKQVLKKGVKNIFIEKPALTDKKEFEEILPFLKDVKLVVGYILRQSKALTDLKKFLYENLKNSYRLTHVTVMYVKNKIFPSFNTESVGVFEEVCHAWDVLFGFLELRQAQHIELAKLQIDVDETPLHRPLTLDIFYRLSFAHGLTDVHVYSSYQSPKRKRLFEFNMENNVQKKKKMILSFDEEDGFDKVSVFDEKNEIYQARYPAHDKLIGQVKQICSYFETGNPLDLHLFSDSLFLQKIYDLTFPKEHKR